MTKKELEKMKAKGISVEDASWGFMKKLLQKETNKYFKKCEIGEFDMSSKRDDHILTVPGKDGKAPIIYRYNGKTMHYNSAFHKWKKNNLSFFKTLRKEDKEFELFLTNVLKEKSVSLFDEFMTQFESEPDPVPSTYMDFDLEN